MFLEIRVVIVNSLEIKLLVKLKRLQLAMKRRADDLKKRMVKSLIKQSLIENLLERSDFEWQHM